MKKFTKNVALPPKSRLAGLKSKTGPAGHNRSSHSGDQLSGFRLSLFGRRFFLAEQLGADDADFIENH